MERIRHDRVLLPERGLGPATITVDGGRIVAVEPEHTHGPEHTCGDGDGWEPGTILAPAFVDLQVNGVDDVDVWSTALDRDDERWDRLEQLLVDRGVGTWCPTLVTASTGKYGPAMDYLAGRTRRADRPTIAGVHLEGPFLGSSTGAHRAELVTFPTSDFFDALPVVPAIVTMGAEHEGVPSVIRELVRRGAVVSIGHTRPERRGYEEAVAAGARMVTHLHNAMSGLAHREPGLAAWALNDDRVVVGLIADGVHVHPDIVRLTFRCKPTAVALVTDSVAWRSGRAGPVEMTLVDGAPRLPDGTLAGSATTMSDSLRVCRSAGVPLEDALRAATSTPARVIGREDVGAIRVGARADLVALDDDLDVVGVWLGGARLR